MAREYVIDGTQFSTLEEFYAHVGSVLIPGQNWGHNLDAFHDILSWPSDDPVPYTLIWENATLSQERLGHSEKVRLLTKQIKDCDPSHVEYLKEELEDARHGEAQTVFDLLVEIIQNNSEYVHLILK